MRLSHPLIRLAALLVLLPHLWAVEAAPAWQSWDDTVFTRAAQQKRLVLLDLGAVWCHWCHVMDETTYRDPTVLARLDQGYLAVQVDQDARPDLANRYEDYGWPATVIFDSSGRELARLRGYIPPERMAGLLQAFIADPTPGPSALNPAPVAAAAQLAGPSAAGAFAPELRATLEQGFRDGYDATLGGWGTTYKYLDADSLEYALLRAREGDTQAATMARTTLDAATALIDPVWGGCYQYSAGGVWSEPHFEKPMAIQAEALRAYALAWATWHRPADRAAAEAIVRYVRGFLTAADGGFYASQDADLHPGEHAAAFFALDDAARRAQGIPRIDRHRYARDNGLMAAALCGWFAASGDDGALALATAAVQWAVAQRALPAGGFRHDGADAAGPYLADTLAMGRACLALHGVTGDRQWLDRALSASRFIAAHFAAPGGAGFLTAATATGGLPSRPQRDENLALARFANLLGEVAADPGAKSQAHQALAWLAIPAVAARRPGAGLLVLDRELSGPPLHIQVLGGRDDPRAVALFRAGLAHPGAYRLVEWMPPAPGAAPFAVVCGAASCSPPQATVEALERYLARRP